MANDPSVYLDATSTVVAKVTWWRDAGPVDLNIGASAQREVSKMSNEGQPSIKVAGAAYPLR